MFGKTAAPLGVNAGSLFLRFVVIVGSILLMVLRSDQGQGVWIVENVFQSGFSVQTHRHTGPVFGYTTSGAWKYREYDYVNRAGSFLYEPAGSVHTLEVLEDDTRVWFHMYGANLNLREDGSVDSVTDGPGTLAAYYALCEAQGLGRPAVLVS